MDQSGQLEKRSPGHRVSKKIRACTPCRQQKLRCDALRSAADSCSRCAANDIPCYFSATFERKKARSKAELQREIDLLRDQVRSPPPPARTRSDRPMTPGAHEMQPSSYRTGSPTVTTSPNRGVSALSTTQDSFTPCAAPLNPTLTTTSRVLDGIYIEDFKINDCFSLFLKHYHSTLPILDPTWGPDSFYALSPFVFWCIVITGARRYELDPTILHRLAPGVAQMALRAMPQFSSYFPTICGLVILCVWPLPMKSLRDDPSPLYSGAAMQIALQHGLHMFPQGQACVRPVPFRDIAHDASLARVWAYVEFVCHCTSWTTGSPPHFFSDAFDYECYTGSIAKSIPPSIRWMQKFDRLCTRATIALSDITSVVTSDPCRSAALNGMIATFDEQIRDISQKALEDLPSKASMATETSTSTPPMYPNSLIAIMSRISINSYHFFGTDPGTHYPKLVELFYLACRWTEQATSLDQATDWALYSSESYSRHILLVAAIILRISHSHQLKSSIEPRAGERAFFAAVKLLKRRSLQSGDVNAQSALQLSELWHNDSCFRRPDGGYDSLEVRIRGRGVMGIAYDCLWPLQSHDSRVSAQEESTNQFPTTRSVPITDPEPSFTAQPLLDMDASIEHDGFDLMTGSSFDLLYNNFQWTQDDCFWT